MKDILPDFKIKPNPGRGYIAPHETAAAHRRAALVRLARAINHAGRDAYRAGRDALGINDDVSIFDMDAGTLSDLARIIGNSRL